MLRAVSTICIESRTLEVLSRRDAFIGFRRALHGAAPLSAAQTVLSGEPPPAAAAAGGVPPAPPPGAAPPPPPGAPPPPRRAWPAAALAAALTASLGGVYFYRKLSDERSPAPDIEESPLAAPAEPPPVPARGCQFPAHVPYLIAGAGTAAFAAMRALRAARPDAVVLLVGEEHALPYMRPPLSKELWREPDLSARAGDPDRLTFRQWNGKRRPVLYEPAAFYTPVEALAGAAGAAGGAGVARGWRVRRLRVAEHEAELEAPGQDPVTIKYDKVLVATGVRARRLAALAGARRAGRALALRGLRDAARLAAALDDPAARTVAVLGGGLLAAELSAALADRLRDSGRRVVLIASGVPMSGVLPSYLARDAARRLEAAGVTVLEDREVSAATVEGDTVRLQLRSTAAEGGEGAAGGGEVRAQLVVECVGSEPDNELAEASGLEIHDTLGGVVVNAELMARADVFAAGDAACFYDVTLTSRRRLEHHDHAVVSGRLAGRNMALGAAPAPYTHQSMFWSDLGPHLGYEAIGIIDSSLPTVGIFSADAVSDTRELQSETQAILEVSGGAQGETGSAMGETGGAMGETGGAMGKTGGAMGETGGAMGETGGVKRESGSEAEARRYERGVVFYLRDQRVVGILLWNLFNRMHIARQVLARGQFDDLLEAGKLFAPHEAD